jgi:acyl carrier protein
MTEFEQCLRTALAELTESDPASISSTATFSEQGVDSLVGLRLAGRIEAWIGQEAEMEWVYDYPSIETLAAYLSHRFGSPRIISN